MCENMLVHLNVVGTVVPFSADHPLVGHRCRPDTTVLLRENS